LNVPSRKHDLLISARHTLVRGTSPEVAEVVAIRAAAMSKIGASTAVCGGWQQH
jgi:hypothetical protein